MLIVFLQLVIRTMGVSLERVQNKFACIIGELTNEPLVLSQFAIWVDLRISEYKSRGTISLDCSGESPDPSWLKGHINPPLHTISGRYGHNSLSHRSRDPARLYQNNRNLDASESADYAAERLSPEVMTMKEEMPESVFPMSIHKHESVGGRKRTAETFPSGDQSELYAESGYYAGQNSASNTFTSTPKVRRVDSAGDDVSAVESPSNQSFMSVIGESLQETDDQSQSESSLLEEQSRGVNAGSRFSTGNAPSSVASQSTTDVRPGTSGSSVPDSQYLAWPGLTGRRKGRTPGRPQASAGYSMSTRHRDTKGIRVRVKNIEQKSEKTIGNLVGAVGSFESWLFLKHGRRQTIETIECHELDGYLAEFFSEVTKPHGGNYDPDSFVSFRSYIERFLKEHGYPYSICRSDCFASSQHAFKERRKTLVKKRQEKLLQEEFIKQSSLDYEIIEVKEDMT